MLVGKFVRPPEPSKETYRFYEDEIRSVEGADAGRGGPEGTAPRG
jgi:hypothetical protein